MKRQAWGLYAIALAILIVGLVTLGVPAAGMGGWGMLPMTVSRLLFWALVVAGLVVLVRYLGQGSRASGPVTVPVTPRQIRAERFARGEFDEDEYRRRLEMLTSVPPCPPPGRLTWPPAPSGTATPPPRHRTPPATGWGPDRPTVTSGRPR